MILIISGTSEMKFQRLVDAVNTSKYLDKMVFQHGVNSMEMFLGRECQDYWTRSDMLKYIKSADLIISHAGIGSILDCLYFNKKLILVERKQELLESKADQSAAIDYFKHYHGIDVCGCLSELDALITKKLAESNKLAEEGNQGPKKISESIRDFLSFR